MSTALWDNVQYTSLIHQQRLTKKNMEVIAKYVPDALADPRHRLPVVGPLSSADHTV